MPTGLGDEKLWLCPTLDNVTPFNDLSDQANNGTAVGGLATVADTSNGGAFAYDFDGTGDYIDCGDVCNFTSQISISSWVKSDSLASNNTIVEKHFTNNIESYNFRLKSDGELNVYTYNTTAGTIGVFGQTTGDVSAGSWYHVVGSYDGTKWQTFVNGVKISELIDSQGIFANPSDLRIGVSEQGTNFTQYFNGLMDDVRIFDRALNQAEIAHLAEARGITGSPPQGLGDEKLWLCPSINNSPNDISGNGNNGVYQNGMGTIADTGSGGSLAYDFDGAGDYINCGNGFNPVANFSIAAWVYAGTWSGDPAGSRSIIEKGYDGANEKFALISRSSGSYLDLYTYISPAEHGIESQVAPPSVANWHHVCGTFDGSNWKLFFNGVQVASDADSTALPLSTQDVSIGASLINASPERYFSGKMDDIRAFDRALTQAEITHLASQRGVLGTPFEGLGDEQLWLCPSLDDNPSDLSANAASISYFNGLATTADTTSGGTRAYDFDAGTVGVNCGDILDSTVWTTGNPFSIAGWAKVGSDGVSILTKLADSSQTPSGSDNREFMFQSRDTGTGMKVDLFYSPGALNTNNFRVFQTNSTVSVGTWYHFAVVYNGPTATNSDPSIYINGVEQASSLAFTAGVDNGPMLDGAASVAAGIALEGANYNYARGGRSDDIRVYSRAITQGEITHLASQRGVLGAPFEGLGDEQLWLCPSLDDSANDISGNGNNGVYQGGMGTVADTGSGGSLAYSFDGTDDYIDCGTASSPTDLTISVWVNKLSFPATSSGVVGNAQSGGINGEYLIWTQGTNARALIYSNGTGGTATLPSNTWVHLVAVRDTTAGFVYLYLDGVLNSQVAITSTPPTLTRDFIIGSYQNSFYFSGLMDDIRFFERAITQYEVSYLASQRGIEGAPSSGPIALVNSTSVKLTGPTTAMDTTGANLLVISCSGYTATPTVSDSESNTWIPLDISGGSSNHQMHYCLNPTTSSTHTFSNDGLKFVSMSVLAFSGVLDFESQASTSSDIVGPTVQPGIMTPSTDGCLVIAGTQGDGGVYVAVDSGFTLETVEAYVAGSSSGNATAYLVQSTASSVNPQFTNTTANFLSASGAVFTPFNGTTPTTGFYNPFINMIFNNDYTRRIR